MATEKKYRNYTIDFLRILAAIALASFHWVWLMVFPGETQGGYWGTYMFNVNHALEGWDWFKGTWTLGFFIFCTGYFLVASFKKLQAKGKFLDKRKHFGWAWHFTAKTYVAYAPLMLFGTTFGYIMTNITNRAALIDWIESFFWNVWQFVGLSGFGMYQNQLLGGATNGSPYLTTYNGSLWYVGAIIVSVSIFYVMLIVSEKATILVGCPLIYMSSMIWLNEWLSPEGAQVRIGITSLIPYDIIRLWAPLCIGIWGWYIVDALKRAKMTKGQETALGIVWLTALAYCCITSWTGYFGGMLNQDLAWAVVAMLTLVNRDPITAKLNEFFSKLPVSKYFADWSAGMYICQAPLLMNLSGAFIAWAGGNITMGGWIYMGITAAVSVLYIFANKYLLKPMYAKLGSFMGLDKEPEVPAFYQAAEN